MGSALYDKGRECFLTSWSTATIKVFLVDAALYPLKDLATDQFLSDIPLLARIGNSGGHTRADAPTLGTKTITDGVADALDVTFTLVPEGSALEYIAVFIDDGVSDASSPLIALIDDATGLPVTPNGENITIRWNNGTNKIFKL